MWREKIEKVSAVVASVALILQMALPIMPVANAANLVSDFKQCANKDLPTNGDCHWISSIVQTSNSKYFEGMSVPQRAIFTGMSGTSHTLTFSHQDTKGGIHAYDWLTSYDQAKQEAIDNGFPFNNFDAETCNPDIGPPGSLGATCATLQTSGSVFPVDVPDDPFVSAHGGSTQAKINAYESSPYGNRTIKLYTDHGSPITAANLILAHSNPINGSDTGDSTINYTLTWTSPSPNILIEMAGHLALSTDSAGISWGAGFGSSQIAGGPYHFSLDKLDGSSLGSQDNQISGSSILPPPQAHLTVIKTVINNNGGTKVSSDFTMHVSGVNPTQTTFAGSATGTVITLDPGAYAVTEDAATGYTGSSSTDCSGTLLSGDNKTCTITNDDQPAHLTVIKHLVNDNGGSSAVTDFSFQVNGGTAASFEADGQNDLTVNAGTYNVTEPTANGYTTTYDNCANLVLANGGLATCTITNNDIAPQLTVIKHVVNDNGGNNVAGDFTMNVTGTNVSDPSFPGDEAGTTVTLNAGSYSVAENGPTGFTESNTLGCSGTIAIGESKTCNVTNNDQPAQITLTKIVENNHGGNAGVNDFGLSVGNNSVVSDSTSIVNSNTPITLNEAGLAGYDFVSITGDSACPTTLGGTVTLSEGQSISCTITNVDEPAHIILTKVVHNNHGGQAGPNAFGISVDGTIVISGATTDVASNSAHSLNETGLFGYQFVSLTGDELCPAVLGGNVTLNEGQTVSCTITNQDIAPQLTVIKHVVNDNGGTLLAGDFTMNVTGTNVSTPTFAGNELGTTVTLDTGTYTADEGTVTGYTKSLSTDCAGSIDIGQIKTCTITNNDIQPKLTVTKIVTNDNGGSLHVSDFPLFVDKTSVTSGTQNGFNTGDYTVGETQQAGYSQTGITGDCATDGTVTLAIGEVKSCTITNDDIAPSLNLVKNVIDDNGGSNVPEDWTLTASGPTTISGAGSVSSDSTFSAGSYHLSESGPSGYTPSDWICDGGTQSDSQITLALGESASCQITNNDIAPTLKLVKDVVNDNGGPANPGDWTLTATGTGGFSDTGDSTTFHTVKAAVTYTLSENSLATGYSPEGWSCDGGTKVGDTITLGLAQDVTCTITNNDIAPQLKVIKHVVNDNGGTASASDFTMNVTGTNVSTPSFPGDEQGTTVTLNAGSYSVDEANFAGYAKTLGTDCSGTINVGETKTCTITNDDIAPQLTVIKHVINNNGGTKLAGDFTMNVTGTNASPASFFGKESGTSVTLDAGSYSANETTLAGYAESLGSDCSGIINIGETKTCTITNDDQPGSLIVKKVVINDNGGTATPNNFSFQVNNGAITGFNLSGENDLTVDAGTYNVTELASNGYAASFDNCSNVIITNGGTATCTVTNNDIAIATRTLGFWQTHTTFMESIFHGSVIGGVMPVGINPHQVIIDSNGKLFRCLLLQYSL